MDDEENQDHLINRNTSQGKSRQQGLFASSDDDNVAESEESGSEEEEEEGLDEEDGEEEEGSDSEEEEDDDEEEPSLQSSGPALSAADLNDGMSSDEERENCPICLNGFRDQVVGTPENCNHYFCLDCIVEWSKNANSCPVDRITFSCIHIRAHYGGEILKKVPILNKNETAVEEDDPTNCEVCGRSDREDRLLLCDGCDAGYHMECLTPALNAVPVDEWFCPECAATNRPEQDQISEEEVTNLLVDVIPTTSRLRTNIIRTRAIARTRQSERVRASVNRIRTTARNTQNVPRYLLSSLLDETIEAVVAGLNTAVYTRDLTPRPAPTRRRRRRVAKKGQSKVSKGGRGVGKRRKRRVKKRRGRRQTNRKVVTSQRRIARSLGICSPTRGTTIPRIQRAPEQTLGTMRSDIGAASLSVFGNPNDLDPFDSNEDSDRSSSPLTAKRRVLSRSALRSHRPVARPISVGLSRGGVAPALGSVAVAEPVPDLLGSILSGQSMLMMKSSDIVISRDGSLTAKKAGDATSQRKTSREAATPADLMEPSQPHSGSPTITSSNTWKPIEQQPLQPSFPSSSGLYSLSPSPPSSSSSLDVLSGHSSSVSGPTFRLKNAFTPRAVQVHSSVSRLTPKSGETSHFNGTFHKRDLPNKNNLTQEKKPENKYPAKPPQLRLDISEFPRIPKIKRETDNSPSNEVSRRLETSTSRSSERNSSGPVMNQLTGRGDSKQLGRFSTAENTERNTQQESQAHLRNTGGTSSSQTSSSSNKAPSYSNSSRNIGSSDAGGGGGLRITISASSANSCRQFSPVSKDPFRNSDGKTPQKTPPPFSATVKKEKTVKNEIYDPFEPTGSDSGSPISSPERPATPPPPPPPPPLPVETPPSTAPSSGVKVGAFRSFKFTSHSSKVSVSKLGPDFSGMSPTNKEPEEPKSQVNASPALPTFIKLEKDIKKEVIEEETNEHPPFRISCPLGLKITSDLKAGGTRGFHFDVKEEPPVVSVKPDPDVLPNRTSVQSTSSNRLIWDEEDQQEPKSRDVETQKKKIIVKEELKASSSSTARKHSRERDSRSPSLSNEDRERDRKYKSKSHKGKRARSDRSSSGSCERSKKKRQKERKKEKKRKRSESRERRRSRSSSRSSSSHRAYNSKKKKKKKRDSRSESPGYSISPDKERKRKHKSEKSYSSKELSSKAKEKKKSKDERGKQRSKSPQISKEIKVHKSKDKTYFRDSEITRHIVLSPNNNEKTITCTVSFKTESPSAIQETKKSVLSLPKEEEDDDDDEDDPFLYCERKVSIKEEPASELSDHSFDEKVKLEADSPPWSPSLLDSLLPETKSEDVSEPPSPQDTSPLNDLHCDSEVASPQNSPMSTASGIPSPKLHSPPSETPEEAAQSDPALPVKKEPDDLQWSPSHLDDLLLNDLSDDVCSLDAASPDDVDLEEAILMKREGDYKEPTIINFSKTAVIPFLQDNEKSVETEAGNHINEKTAKSKDLEESKSDELKEKEPTTTSISKSKPQIKRVTWNLQDKASDTETPDQSLSSPFYNTQQEESWTSSEKQTDVKVSSYDPVPTIDSSSSSVTWTLPNKSTEESAQEVSWAAVNKSLTHIGIKLEDKPIVHSVDKHTVQPPERPEKDASQVPWTATGTPIQVFPQTLPPLPLPPIFPPYAPLSEPTVPCMVQSSRTVLSQTPKPGSLATTDEPKIQAASTGEGKGKSKLKKEEKVKNEEYMKKLHIQERAVEEVKLAIKPFYQKREITKEEYKEILRKAVQKICHSKSGEINPVKVVNLVKGYVDKYKHIRNKSKKSGAVEDHVLGHDSPV